MDPLTSSLVLIYPASEAPNYPVGYKAAAGFCVACLLFTGVFKYKDLTLRRRGLEERDDYDRDHQREELDDTAPALVPVPEVRRRIEDGEDDAADDDEGKRI